MLEKKLASNETFVELNNITKSFGKNVVIDNFNLSVAKGEMITLLGPSGCGKTTILRLLAGLEKPTAGQIKIDGEDVTNLSIQQRDICMVFQSYALFPHMSIGENIGYGLKMIGVPKDERKQLIEESLELVDLAGFADRFVDQISGGQQQRVALARAMVLKPKVLLFDEPLSNLDANLRRSMREKIRELQQRFNITSFYVTHDQTEAFAVSDKVLVMNKGKIMQLDSPQRLYRRPASRFMANFMGDANIFPGYYEDGHISIFGYKLDVEDEIKPKQAQCVVGIRPEAIELTKQGEESQICTVEGVAYMGHQYEVSVNWHDQILLLQVNSIRIKPTIGEQFYIQIHPEGMFVLDES